VSKGQQQNVVKGLVAGAIAGAAGSAAMDGYWWVCRSVFGDRPEQKPKGGKDGQEEEQPSTQIIADKVSEAITGEEVPKKGKPAAGVGVHYATGVGFGALYGLVASRRPETGLLAGLIYGVAIWFFLDEIGLRALDLAPDAEKVPPSQHLQALGAHFVFGTALSVFTRPLLSIRS
jgi:putative membrane protein